VSASRHRGSIEPRYDNNFSTLTLSESSNSPSAELAEASLQEVADFGRTILQEWQASGDPRGALLSARPAHPVPITPQAADFVCSTTHIGSEPTVEGASKLAFAALSLFGSTHVHQLLRHVARAAYHRVAPALAPYVTEADLLDRLRLRTWLVSAEHFSESEFLKHPGVVGLLSTSARNIALDELRRLTSDRRREQVWTETYGRKLDAPHVGDTLDDEVEQALLEAGKDLPPVTLQTIVDILGEVTSREAGLRTINQDRTSRNQEPWTDGALRTAISRYRQRVRDSLKRGG
jgi:hypothetical protein